MLIFKTLWFAEESTIYSPIEKILIITASVQQGFASGMVQELHCKGARILPGGEFQVNSLTPTSASTWV